MDTIHTRKRIEYRAKLTVVRTGDLIPVKKNDLVIEDKAEAAGVVKTATMSFMPVDPKGYIKCKTHDFF